MDAIMATTTTMNSSSSSSNSNTPSSSSLQPMMITIKNRDRILEAIDQLRRRKARPDIQRICNYLFRRFSINVADARADLQACVDTNVVLKVEYKGSISYRNAAKKFAHHMKQLQQRGGQHHHHATTNQQQQRGGGDRGGGGLYNNKSKTIDIINNKANRKFAQLLTNAFGELYVIEPDFLELGVPADEIINNILSKDSVRYTKKYINILIEKEVDGGGLIKMENGNYLMGPTTKIVEQRCNNNSGGNNNNKVSGNGSGGGTADTISHHIQQNNEIVGGGVIVDSGCYNSNDNDNNREKMIGGGGGGDGHNNHHIDTMMKVKKKRGRMASSKKDNVVITAKSSRLDNNGMDSSMDEKKSENGNLLRVGGRRKRAKKVFDPSDTHVPKKRGRPAGSLNRATIEKQLSKGSDDSRPESRASNSGGGNSNSTTTATATVATPKTDQSGVCSVCHLQNKKGPNDRMVACRECSNKAHFSCLNGDDMMLRMYPDNTWQCPHCKTCVICYETSDSGYLVVCAVCADAYHATCHQPRVTEKIKSNMKWTCINCDMPDELKLNEIKNTFTSSSNNNNDNNKPPVEELSTTANLDDNSLSSPPTSGVSTPSLNEQSPIPSPTPPQLSPQESINHHNLQNGNRPDSGSNTLLVDRCGGGGVFAGSGYDSPIIDSDDDANIDPSIPDASHWSAEEVYQYFAQYFPEEAKVFRDQEIDGRSLLLLKRLDVLTNLKLKLGPALKIYRHVVKLQARRDDTKLYWL